MVDPEIVKAGVGIAGGAIGVIAACGLVFWMLFSKRSEPKPIPRPPSAADENMDPPLAVYGSPGKEHVIRG